MASGVAEYRMFLFLPPAHGRTAQPPVSYRKQIAPLFAANCNACHGGASPQSGLALSSYALLLKGGRRGKAIVPGDPAKSLLVQLVAGIKQPRMPVGGALKPEEIALIRRWVKEGAKSDGDAPAAAPAPPRIPLRIRALPQVAALAWGQDGKLLAVGGYQEVKLLEPGSGTLVRTLKGHADLVRALAFTADGTRLAAAGGVPGLAGEIKVWNAQTGQLLKTFTGHMDSIYSVAWQPDGKRFVTCSYDKTVKLWDMSKPQPIADLKEHSEAVFATAWSVDGKYFATAGSDRSIRVWDGPTGKRLYALTGHDGAISSLAFQPKQGQLASGAADKSVRIWSLKPDSGAVVRSLSPNPDAVTAIAFSPEGTELAAACANGAVALWKVDTAEKRLEIKSGSDTALSVAYRPDGKVLAIGGFDGSVKLFTVTDGKLAATCIAPPQHLRQATGTSK